MRLLPLGLKFPVAAGLDWQLPRDPKAVRDTPRQFARKLHGRVEGQDGDIAFGEDKGEGDRSASAYCGAALIAAAAPDAFVYHELPVGEDEEPLIWVCGVGRGVPMPGFDAVLPVSEARAKYTEFVSFNNNAQVYGSLSESRASLEELFTRVTEKQRKACRLVRAGVSTGAVVAALALPLIVGGVTIGVMQYEQARERERITHQQMIERELASALQRKQIEDQRNSFNAEVAARRREFAEQPETMETVDGWVTLLSKQVPISHKGWQPLSAGCTRAACTVRWRPGQQALPIHMLELPGRLESSDVANPTTVIELSAAPASARSKVSKVFKLDLLSFSKATGTVMTVTLRGEPQQVRVEPTKDLAALGQQPVAVATIGRFQATFSNLLALREFARWARPLALSIERMEAVAFSPTVGSPAYQIEGMFVLADDAR